MNKQIKAAVGILIILLFAGAVGASVFFLSQEDEELVLLEEEIDYEEEEIIDVEEEEKELEVEKIDEAVVNKDKDEKKDPEIKSVEFIPSLKSREISEFTYTPGTKMIVEVVGHYESACLAKSGGPGIEATCDSHDGLPVGEEKKDDRTILTFELTRDYTTEGFSILCHRMSDFHEIHFFDKEVDLDTTEKEPVKKYYCSEIKELIEQ